MCSMTYCPFLFDVAWYWALDLPFGGSLAIPEAEAEAEAVAEAEGASAYDAEEEADAVNDVELESEVADAEAEAFASVFALSLASWSSCVSSWLSVGYISPALHNPA